MRNAQHAAILSSRGRAARSDVARLLSRRSVSASMAAARAPARTTTASGSSAMRATFRPACSRASLAPVPCAPVRSTVAPCMSRLYRGCEV